MYSALLSRRQAQARSRRRAVANVVLRTCEEGGEIAHRPGVNFVTKIIVAAEFHFSAAAVWHPPCPLQPAIIAPACLPAAPPPPALLHPGRSPLPGIHTFKRRCRCPRIRRPRCSTSALLRYPGSGHRQDRRKLCFNALVYSDPATPLEQPVIYGSRYRYESSIPRKQSLLVAATFIWRPCTHELIRPQLSGAAPILSG